MVKTKKMDESGFDAVLKEITAHAEMIATRQDEKQSVMNDFEKERHRLKSGKIPKKSVSSSIPRIKKELKRLDSEIRKNIKSLQKAADKAKKTAIRQSPKNIKVSMHGLSVKSKKRRSHKKKKKR